jgi:hypothetical protein
MCPFSQPTGFFEQSWWQGIAGLFQILAGIFAIITIWQSRKMQKEAEQQRKESVAADWEIIKQDISTQMNGGEPTNRVFYSMVLINTGFGFATNTDVEFHSNITTKKVNFHFSGVNSNIAQGKTYAPNDKISIGLSFSETEYPLKGYFLIKNKTRFGESQECRINFELTNGINQSSKDYCRFVKN